MKIDNETKVLAIIVILSCAVTLFLYRPLFNERRVQRENARECQKEFDRAEESPSVDPNTGLTMYPIPNCDPGPTPHLLPLLEYIDQGYLMLSAVLLSLAGIAIGITSFILKRRASSGSFFLYLSSALFGISTQQHIVYTYPEFGMISYIFIFAIITTLIIAWIFGLKIKSRSLRVIKCSSVVYVMLYLLFGFCQLWEAFSMLYLFICAGGGMTILWQKRRGNLIIA